MKLQDCIEFANANPVCYLATVDGEQPRARTMLLWYADESGFYFTTLESKELIQQMRRQPRAEACFFNNAQDPAEWVQVRVSGPVEFLDDAETLDKAYENRRFLDDIMGRSVKPILRPFRIGTGEAFGWTLADNMKEAEIERVSF